MSNAFTTKLLSKLEENAQPTIRLENTSSTIAKYNQPSIVGKYVMSESHF